MLRRAVLLVLVTLAALFAATPASAGGSWLEVSGGQRVRTGGWDLAYAAVGSTVTMRGDFSSGQLSPVSAGPWFAYLSADDGGKSERRLLGPVDIANSGGYPFVATTSFVVPDVPAGYYSVTVCDMGCSLVGVGDLIGGSFFVGATTREARSLARLQILQWMREDDARTIGRLSNQVRELRFELEHAQDATERAISRAATAETRAEEATVARDQIAAQLAARERSVDRWRWATAILAGAVVASALVIARAHRPRVVVPDSPAELTEEADQDHVMT